MLDICIIVGVKVCDIYIFMLELFEKVFGLIIIMLAWKKVCLINCIFNELQLVDVLQIVSWKLEGIDWIIYNYVNVFFCIGFDIGVCFFM